MESFQITERLLKSRRLQTLTEAARDRLLRIPRDPVMRGLMDLAVGAAVLFLAMALLPGESSVAPFLLIVTAFVIISRSLFSSILENILSPSETALRVEDGELKVTVERLYREKLVLTDKLDELAAIREVALAIGSILDFDKMIHAVLELACGSFETSKAFIYVCKDDEDVLEIVGARAQGRAVEPSKVLLKRVPFGAGIVGQAASERKCLFASQEGKGAAAAVPLIVKDNVVGVLKLSDANPARLASDRVQRMQVLANAIAVAIENARLYKMAVTDGLTGLSVHRHFQHRLEDEFARSRRYNAPLALLLTDIDHFKSFNDTHGHTTGDAVLRSVAELLTEEARDTDTVCRYGGEEFAVICPETRLDGALHLAERIRSRCERMLHADANGEKRLNVTISLGVALFEKGMSERRELIEKADKALYKAKENGRNRIETFDASNAAAIA